jgi:uncharacterized membrane protein YhaH (DUF805 family)
LKRPDVLFRLRGRLPRGGFFLRVVLILAAFALLDAMLRPLIGQLAVWLLNPIALWALVAAAVQRLHDRDYSGRWLAVAVVPVLGAAWLLWQFCSRGAASDNRWGPDPKRDMGQFLVVG